VDKKQITQSVWENPIHFLAFGFGFGLAPVAPGTFGTLVAIPIYYLLMGLPVWAYIAIVVALFLFGIFLCETTSNNLKVHDHSGIVWDEIVGYLITMIAAPQGWQWAIIGFILFRFFDILKPWPIKTIDTKIKGGFGIMFDDVVAGIFGLIIIQAIVLFY